MNYSIGKIPNKYNFFVLTVTLLLMSTGATPDFASDNCRSATEIWEDQMDIATGPPCPVELQGAIDSMYSTCGGRMINETPNFWNVTIGSEWDDTNNATKNAVEVFGCSGAHRTTVLSVGLSVLMSIVVASITAVL
jgi:hypothetical protein